MRIRRTIVGGFLALPQVVAWMITASMVNLTRERFDYFFRPMWLAVILIIVVLASGAVFVRGLWGYLKGERTYTLAGAGAVISMTAAVALLFVTAVLTYEAS